MITIRQMERDWVGRKYEKLFDVLVEHRPEGSFPFDLTDGRAIPTAAMSLIRLDELSQTHVPLYTHLLRAVLASQNANDGGWGDPVVTALCLRALTAGRGNGLAVDLGMHYLADLQKVEGLWPAGPIRRLPADPAASAFVLYQLADKPAFRELVRFDDAVSWFDTHQSSLDADGRKWWGYAKLRCQAPVLARATLALSGARPELVGLS